MWSTFRQNQQLWIFVLKFAPKAILRSEFQKSKPGFRINNRQILCGPIFRQREQLWIFGHKFVKKCILESEFEKSKSVFGISIQEILCVPIFRLKRQFWTFLVFICPKVDLGVRISKIKVWIWNQHPSDTVCTFSDNATTLNFWAQFSPKMDFGNEISKI